MVLKQRVGGQEATLFTGSKWNSSSGFKAAVSANPALTFTAIKNGQATALIKNHILPPATQGKLAFGVLANSTGIDNFQLHSNP